MADAEKPPLEKQAHEAVVALLTKQADAPPADVAKTICQMLALAARGGDPHPGVVASCKGGMGPVLAGHHHPPETASLILAGLSDMSLMSRVGPTDLMSWAMEGIAEAVVEIAREERHPIAEAINERFTGAGEIFAGLCDKALAAAKPQS